MQENQTEELRKTNGNAKELVLRNLQDSKMAQDAFSNQAVDSDNQHRSLVRKMNEAHSQELAQLNHHLERQTKSGQDKNGESLREKDEYYTGIIHQKNQETHDGQKELRDAYGRQIEDMKKQEKRSEEHLNQSLADHVTKSEEERATALADQAKNYTAAAKNLKQSYEEKLERLKQSQENALDRDGTPQMSVAAEGAIRKSLIKEYETTLNAEMERNKNATEQTQRKYSDSYQKLLTNTGDRETRAQQSHEKEKSDERFQFFSTVDEIQHQSSTHKREQHQEHEKEVEDLYRQFGKTLEKQKKNDEYTFYVAQNSANEKISSMRQEMQVRAKEATRALSERQNELIREYEKKLTDQKSDYDNQIDEIKAQNLRDLRDLERKNKQEIEAQSKGYDQRLIQGEAQSRERERNITQSYQNELDRTRRSYELLSQKKS